MIFRVCEILCVVCDNLLIMYDVWLMMVFILVNCISFSVIVVFLICYMVEFRELWFIMKMLFLMICSLVFVWDGVSVKMMDVWLILILFLMVVCNWVMLVFVMDCWVVLFM